MQFLQRPLFAFQNLSRGLDVLFYVGNANLQINNGPSDLKITDDRQHPATALSDSDPYITDKDCSVLKINDEGRIGAQAPQ